LTKKKKFYKGNQLNFTVISHFHQEGEIPLNMHTLTPK